MTHTIFNAQISYLKSVFGAKGKNLFLDCPTRLPRPHRPRKAPAMPFPWLLSAFRASLVHLQGSRPFGRSQGKLQASYRQVTGKLQASYGQVTYHHGARGLPPGGTTGDGSYTHTRVRVLPCITRYYMEIGGEHATHACDSRYKPYKLYFNSIIYLVLLSL